MRRFLITVAAAGLLVVGSNNVEATTFSEEFENGTIDQSLWDTGGRKVSWTPADQGSWSWSHEELTDPQDGYLQAKVWGPASANSYGAWAWIQTTSNFNDGKRNVIDFTWQPEVPSDNGVYFIQIANGANGGDIPSFGEQHWDAPLYGDGWSGSVDLLRHTWSNNLQHAGMYFPGEDKKDWSIVIEPTGTATLYDGPGATGSMLRQEVLNPADDWYVRWIVREATSAGFGAGEARLNLYSVSAVPEPTTLALATFGFAGLAVLGRHRRQ